MSDHVDIGLVNNMPDSALKGTERQFRTLLSEAGGDVAVRLHLFTLPEIARSERARQHCRESYGTLRDLLSSRLDALIVTGAEPRTVYLSDEPYWRSLTTVLDWANHNTISCILSCLAAHAGVLHFDAIERTPLPGKCLGRFDQAVTPGHALTADAPAQWRVPHSRCNELREEALSAAGYTVLSRSDQAGVDVFVKQRRSLFLFCQGHPEYERETLHKEHLRDVRRFLAGEAAEYPAIPAGYYDRDTEALLTRFAARAAEHRNPDMMRSFPHTLLDGVRAHAWSAAGLCLYRNWLRGILERARAGGTGRPTRPVPSRDQMLAA